MLRAVFREAGAMPRLSLTYRLRQRGKRKSDVRRPCPRMIGGLENEAAGGGGVMQAHCLGSP